jgi:hypothetical protein
MPRILAALSIIAFILTLGSFSASAADKMSSMGASTMTCPAGATFVKGYKKADGTQVAGYCRSSKAAVAMKCPPGQTAVAAYTKQNGTKVKGYCRKG